MDCSHHGYYYSLFETFVLFCSLFDVKVITHYISSDRQTTHRMMIDFNIYEDSDTNDITIYKSKGENGKYQNGVKRQ
jgi:hypothetical protein